MESVFFMCPIDSAGRITPPAPADVDGASISAG